MKSLGTRARTALALGIGDVAAVLLYRAFTKAAALTRPNAAPSPRQQGDFLEHVPIQRLRQTRKPTAVEPILLFGVHPLADGASPPQWFRNPFTLADFPNPARPWYSIADFDERVGDIKVVWEVSRFDWAMQFARHATDSDPDALRVLNEWLHDWDCRNPPYQGPNWMCGQEASLRVLNLSAAALALGGKSAATPRLVEFLESHARRIALTARYAEAQRNNHATSEAAALFVAGTWLESFGHRSARAFERQGRRRLEEHLERLVGAQGGFSQYSVNYHRLMLDTCCVAELTRRALGGPPFSDISLERLVAATSWLERLVDPQSGDAPNIGANDGARILQTTHGPYRDFRQTVQLSSALFRGSRAYRSSGSYDEAFQLFGIDRPAARADPPGPAIDDDGGFAVLRHARALAVLRYPRFRFRPSHADALHVDLWVDGVNLLRDSGTYSYNQDPALYEYLASVRAHNTIEFDDRDQMPRLGRFLHGDWLKTERVEFFADKQGTTAVEAAYVDAHSARHERRIELGPNSLHVIDRVSGFQRKATLRWRLPPADWSVTNSANELTLVRHFESKCVAAAVIRSTAPAAVARLTEGWESTHYLQKERVCVLELGVALPGTIESVFSWT